MIFTKILPMKDVCESQETSRFSIIKVVSFKILNPDNVGVKNIFKFMPKEHFFRMIQKFYFLLLNSKRYFLNENPGTGFVLGWGGKGGWSRARFFRKEIGRNENKLVSQWRLFIFLITQEPVAHYIADETFFYNSRLNNKERYFFFKPHAVGFRKFYIIQLFCKHFSSFEYYCRT